MVEFLEHVALDEGIEIGEIRDHARGRVHVSRQADLHDVVVAVAVRIAAFPKDAAILLFLRCAYAADVTPKNGTGGLVRV